MSAALGFERNKSACAKLSDAARRCFLEKHPELRFIIEK
jgi:hypothetical protein